MEENSTTQAEPRGQLYEEIKEGTEKAKTGELSPELLFKLKGLMQAGDLPPALHNSFGWFLYFRLKISRPNDFAGRKADLATYLKLNPAKPSPLHSLMLHEAVRLKKEKPSGFRFANFLDIWGLENLRNEDWLRYETDDGRLMASLAEKTIACYAKELPGLKTEAPREISDIADRLMERYTDNPNLPLYKAEICLSQGNREEALDHIRSLLLKQPSRGHLWRKAYELVGNADLRIAFLCKAISLQKDEAFLGNIRLKLARLLLKKNLPHHALHELQKYHQLYSSRRWHISKEYDYLRNRISADITAADDREVYLRFMPLADEFLFSALPAMRAVKISERRFDDKYHPGKSNLIWTLKTDDAQTLFLRNPDTKGLAPDTADGTPFQVRISDGKVVWIKPI